MTACDPVADAELRAAPGPTWVFTVASPTNSRCGDLRVGQALGQQREHLELAGGQLVQPGRRRRAQPVAAACGGRRPR